MPLSYTAVSFDLTTLSSARFAESYIQKMSLSSRE